MLRPSEVEAFATVGYLGPYALMRPDEMAIVRRRIEDEVFATVGTHARDRLESRHQDKRVVWDICSSPLIVERVADLLGENILLWNSVFFVKEPAGAEIPWHQDLDFLLLEPNININVWLAIDHVTPENGCLEFIPGSHTTDTPHIPRRHAYEFVARADMNLVDRRRAVHMPLLPGEFVMFDKNLLHHSATNMSLSRRAGIAMRYTVPHVRVKHDSLFAGHYVLVVRGTDTAGVNRLGTPPMS